MGKQLVNIELVLVEIRQVQTTEKEKELQKVYDSLRGRVDLEKPIYSETPRNTQ